MSPELQTFLDKLAETLEVPSVALDDDFRVVPMWSSLVGFSVMVLFENEFGKVLTAAELQAAQTVGDLARRAGVA